MALSFSERSHKSLATKKLRELRRAETAADYGDELPLINLMWEEAIARDKHGKSYLPDKEYNHYCRYYYHKNGMSIGGYVEEEYELSKTKNHKQTLPTI